MEPLSIALRVEILGCFNCHISKPLIDVEDPCHLEFEIFISEPEKESKKLMKFCELSWDQKCLEFYKRKDLISQTASNIQIRKAIYKDSIKKYVPYKKLLSKYGDKYFWFN